MTLAIATDTQTELDIDLPRSKLYCRRLTKQAARNFYYGLKLLPEPKRSDMFALYAYMRHADDIADDECGRTPAERLDALEAWRTVTHQALAGDPPRGASLTNIANGSDAMLWPAFSDMAVRRRPPGRVFDDALAGHREDVAPKTFRTFADLHEYCYRVAGTVGIASIYVWGFDGGEETVDLAIARGVALQLTNVLRDLREDATRGRVYLPEEDLAQAELTRDDLHRGCAGQPTGCGEDRFRRRFRELMRFEVARAEEHYAKSRPLDGRIAPDSRATLCAMTEIYHRLLRKVAAEPERVLRQRVSLSFLVKLRVAWHATRVL